MFRALVERFLVKYQSQPRYSMNRLLMHLQNGNQRVESSAGKSEVK